MFTYIHISLANLVNLVTSFLRSPKQQVFFSGGHRVKRINLKDKINIFVEKLKLFQLSK
jgi:hypothetical protein